MDSLPPGYNPNASRRKFSMESDTSVGTFMSAPSNVTDEQMVKPNYKCSKYGCNYKFYLEATDNLIRCPECGHRILDKLRTRKYITYKTE